MEGSTILVVDDSKDFIFLLSSLLKFHKIKVDGAPSAEAALTLCQDKKYALILTDYMMDEKNGLEFCRELRASGMNQPTPIILITSKNLERDELSVLSELSVTYIKKPIMPNELYRKITDILGRKA